MPIAFVFTLVSCSTNSKEESSVDTTLVTKYDYSQDELQLAQLINDYRVSHGLNALQIVNHISYKSLEHNEYMIDNNVVNHDYFDQRAENIKEVLGATKVGENIAYNYSTANGALTAWLNSSGHKANIEGDYTHFGFVS